MALLLAGHTGNVLESFMCVAFLCSLGRTLLTRLCTSVHQKRHRICEPLGSLTHCYLEKGLLGLKNVLCSKALRVGCWSLCEAIEEVKCKKLLLEISGNGKKLYTWVDQAQNVQSNLSQSNSEQWMVEDLLSSVSFFLYQLEKWANCWHLVQEVYAQTSAGSDKLSDATNIRIQTLSAASVLKYCAC